MPDQNWQFELEEYIKQGEPDRAEKSVGLQYILDKCIKRYEEHGLKGYS